jgi:Uma2 family endonuclease
MASATRISAREYLTTKYDPDRELIDGQFVERNIGEYDHGSLQGALVAWFHIRRHEWNIRVLPAQRVQVKSDRFRIPDVCVLSRDQPIEPVVTHPPLICIEVLSKDDTLRGMQDQVNDYLNFGVVHIWILDPVLQLAYVCDRTGFHQPESGVLKVGGTPIDIGLTELFAELD